MKSKQMIVGNNTEAFVAKLFQENKYWAYILPKKIGGQPFDVIACKNDVIWFVDAKHLEAEEASFSFERIEPNQRTSMRYARNFAGINNLGFVIRWDRDDSRVFFLSYDKLVELEQNGVKSVKIESLENFMEVINENNNK